MHTRSPKNIRRRILTVLYDHYLDDPLQMLSPGDILEDGALEREDLPANIFYLYDRGLIELMIGYSPPMFDAARIAPPGIDIVEDPIEFNRQFPDDHAGKGHIQSEAMPLIMRLAEEADRAPLEGIKRDWLLRDVRLLRDELRQPNSQLHIDRLRETLDWIPDYFDGAAHQHLPTLEELTKMFARAKDQND